MSEPAYEGEPLVGPGSERAPASSSSCSTRPSSRWRCPAIRSDLDATLDGLQWIQNAYLLTLAATVVAAGRLGDIVGRRRVFIWGMALFALGSLVAGAATSEEMLVGGRVLQGIGGAALLSLSLALTSARSRPSCGRGRSGSGPPCRRWRSPSGRSSAAC